MDLCKISTPFLPHNCETLEDYALQYGTKVEYQRKDIIYEPGEVTDRFWYIDSGQVKCCFFTNSGEERTVFVLENGMTLGEELLLGETHSTMYGVAESFLVTYEICGDIFWKLFDHDKNFQRKILDSTNHKFLVMRKSYEEVTSLTAKERLLNLLVASINMEREYGDGWYFLKNKYNNKELGSILGVSSLTISRMLGEFEKDGTIKVVSRNILIKQYKIECVTKSKGMK